MSCATTRSTGAATCGGPWLDDQPPGVTVGAPPPSYPPGGSFTLHGHWFTSTCNDTGDYLPVRPLPAVHLTMTLSDGRTLPLGTGTPHGAEMGFSIDVAVPEDAAPGTASIQDDTTDPHTFRFIVGSDRG